MTPAKTSTFLSGASASALAKAILVGEHAVVYGARAIAMPLRGLAIDARLVPGSREFGASSAPELHVNGVPVPESIRAVLDDAIQLMELPSRPFRVEGTSSIPAGGGLGGSAALCVVILRLLHAAHGINATPERIADLAHTLERRFHGNPSGLDTTVVALERPVRFRRGETPLALSIAEPARRWRFAVIDSGLRAATSMMVERCAPAFKGPAGDVLVSAFDSLADDASESLARADHRALAEIINECQKRLDTIGAGHKRLTDIIATTRRVGIPAAKLTGAGGGGAVLALLDEANAPGVFNALVSSLPDCKVYEATL